MWDDTRALSGLATTLTLMAVLALLAAATGWLARQPLFAIREVVVTTPLVRASAPGLEAVIRNEIDGTFFTMDLERARASIGSVPWVRAAALRRQWPQRLEITIEEHAPLAHFSEGVLVNTFGEVFEAGYPGALPRFSGPAPRAGEMTMRYREWSSALAPLMLEVVELAMSDRGGWRIRALGEHGPLTLELGRDEAPARLARFVAAYSRTVGALGRQGTRIEHVDLRYRNGFAARIPAFREASKAQPG